jgi:hypothetical protein
MQACLQKSKSRQAGITIKQIIAKMAVNNNCYNKQ